MIYKTPKVWNGFDAVVGTVHYNYCANRAGAARTNGLARTSRTSSREQNRSRPAFEPYRGVGPTVNSDHSRDAGGETLDSGCQTGGKLLTTARCRVLHSDWPKSIDEL